MAMRDPVNINIKVPTSVAETVLRFAASKNLTKSEALRSLVFLALNHADSEPINPQGDDVVSCTLKLSKREFSDTSRYRSHHGHVKKTKFFRDALYRGIAIQEGGGEGS